jgi:hypothetical protein
MVIILIILMYSPKLYTKYIQFRQKEIDSIRQHIYKHLKDNYIYLPSRNLMTYNLNYPISLEYWINYITNEQRKTNKN